MAASAPARLQRPKSGELQGDGDGAGVGLRGADGAEGLERPLLGDGKCLNFDK